MSDQEKFQHSNKDHLDKLAMEQLEALLIATDDNNFDLIDQIMEVIASREASSPAGRIRDIDVAWSEFNQYYRDIPDDVMSSLMDGSELAATPISTYQREIVASAKSPNAAIKQASPKKRFSRLSTVAAMFAIAFVTVTGLQAAGVDLIGEFVKWTNETFHFVSTPTTEGASMGAYPIDIDEEAHFDSLDDALQAFEVTGITAPTWIPEEFTHVETLAVRHIEKTRIDTTYINGSQYLFFSIWNVAEDFVQIEKDDSTMDVLIWNNITYYLMSNFDLEVAAWQHGTLEGTISGHISRDELKEIIYSINQ